MTEPITDVTRQHTTALELARALRERDAEIARLTEAIQAAVGFLEYPASRDLFGMRRGWAADCLRAALRQEGTGR